MPSHVSWTGNIQATVRDSPHYNLLNDIAHNEYIDGPIVGVRCGQDCENVGYPVSITGLHLLPARNRANYRMAILRMPGREGTGNFLVIVPHGSISFLTNKGLIKTEKAGLALDGLVDL